VRPPRRGVTAYYAGRVFHYVLLVAGAPGATSPFEAGGAAPSDVNNE